MQISVKSDVKQLTKSLTRIQRKQIPFATSKALNNVAFDVRKSLQDGLDIHLDRPTPYTKRGVQVEKSTKKKLVAEVGFRSKTFGKGQGSVTQASYMERQIKGGLRTPKGSAIPVPIVKNLKLNKYGSITKNKINNALGNVNKFFSGKPKGAKSKGTGEGIWERYGGKRNPKIKMIISWNKTTDYQARYPFKNIVTQSVRKNFRKRFDNAIREALKTAR